MSLRRGLTFASASVLLVSGAQLGMRWSMTRLPEPAQWLSAIKQCDVSFSALAVVTGAIAIFPVGAPLVWIPVTIWLLTEGHTGWAIFMALYGTFAISGIDNVLRPAMISRGADLPFLLTILGAFGGVFAFGFLGLVLGPVLLAVGFRLMIEFGQEEAPPMPAGSGEAPP